MLKIFNTLAPFIENCNKEFSVREYARILKISPPNASKILKSFKEKGLLNQRNEKLWMFFRVNKESEILKDISRVYWKLKLEKTLAHLNSNLKHKTILLAGPLSTLETEKDSGVDLLIVSDELDEHQLSNLNLMEFEKELGRLIRVTSIKSKKLSEEMLSHYVLKRNTDSVSTK